jgi:rhamnose utilization protein RhaD (predicted bifunctional aldolase and dehydrogenase)
LKNLWIDAEAKKYNSDLELRVYSSNLLGQSDELVLHGGGNTSVKSVVDGENILFVKGSGWDLVSIKTEGFSPVKMEALLEMAKLKSLSDIDMVSSQKKAMIDNTAPNPSVEAILHALIPFKVVDHTHADAIVTMSNSLNGKKFIAELFPNFLIIPYVMPGFILAQKIYEATKNDFDWNKCEGIILHNHGIFTFDDDAKKSYDKMIKAVTLAEDFLATKANVNLEPIAVSSSCDVKKLKELVEEVKGHNIITQINQSPLALKYASKTNLHTFATRGVLTPEHILRTKRVPLILDNKNMQESIDSFIENYKSYFNQYSNNEIMLNPAPNYAVVRDYGVICFGKNEKEVSVVSDIVEHTMLAVLRADMLGGYKSISKSDSFDMEYWELEQAKLKK